MKHSSSDVYYATFFDKSVCFIISVFLKFWYSTMRFNVSGEMLSRICAPEKLVGVTWHNRVAFTPMMKIVFRKKYPMCGLVSSSKDGAWLAALFEFFGVKCVRGSTTRHGARAIVEMVKLMKQENASVFITPDGPLGPPYKAKIGALTVAKNAESRILVFKISPRRYFTLNTWDKFIIPMPFSAIDVECKEFKSYEALELCARENNCTPTELMDALMGNNP